MIFLNLANCVSLFRLFSSVFIVLWIQEHDFSHALILFSVAAFSDFLDGFLARFFKTASRVGAYLDPLADKVLLVSVFVALTVQHKIPVWVTALVVARDVQILAGVALLYALKRPVKMAPLLISKINTAFQMLLIFVCLFAPFTQNLFYDVVLYGAVLSTLLSGVFYVPLWCKSLWGPPATP